MSVDNSVSQSLPVALPYTIRRSSEVFFLPFTASYRYRAHIDAAMIRWRWVLVALMVGGLVFFIAYKVNLSTETLFVVGALAMGAVASLCLSENAFRRDRLVQGGIERRSGIFGQHLVLIPFHTIWWVTVEDPGGLWPVNVGNLIVRADDSTHHFLAVAEPKAIASAIETFRRQAKESG